MPAAQRCCRSCPRCADCPVVAMAATRATRRRESAVASLVTEVLGGRAARRELPEPVSRTLQALDAARRGGAAALLTRS
jgi:hypothetical protein